MSLDIFHGVIFVPIPSALMTNKRMRGGGGEMITIVMRNMIFWFLMKHSFFFFSLMQKEKYLNFEWQTMNVCWINLRGRNSKAQDNIIRHNVLKPGKGSIQVNKSSFDKRARERERDDSCPFTHRKQRNGVTSKDKYTDYFADSSKAYFLSYKYFIDEK